MKIKSKWVPYAMMLPAFTLICIFKIYPVVSSFVEGFTFDGHFSLQVYDTLFHDKTFWNSLWVTVKFNLICIPLQVSYDLPDVRRRRICRHDKAPSRITWLG